jgi:hypothetical protein
MSAYMKDACFIVALLAWCGAMWSQVRFAKQLRADGYSIWTFNVRARLNAWKGANIVLFLSCGAVFAASIFTAIAIS